VKLQNRRLLGMTKHSNALASRYLATPWPDLSALPTSILPSRTFVSAFFGLGPPQAPRSHVLSPSTVLTNARWMHFQPRVSYLARARAHASPAARDAKTGSDVAKLRALPVIQLTRMQKPSSAFCAPIAPPLGLPEVPHVKGLSHDTRSPVARLIATNALAPRRPSLRRVSRAFVTAS